MYKVCFSDDEPLIHRVMASLVDWEAAGFVVAGTTTNGQETLELVAQVQPDLLFIDIHMPVMDGLACIARLRESGSTIKIIVLSAHDEFEYAQRAIELGVDGYLLKPVNREAVNNLVGKIGRELREQKERRLDTQLLRELQQLEAASRTPPAKELTLLTLRRTGCSLLDLLLCHPTGEEVAASEVDAFSRSLYAFLEAMDAPVLCCHSVSTSRLLVAVDRLPTRMLKALEGFLSYSTSKELVVGLYLWQPPAVAWADAALVHSLHNNLGPFFTNLPAVRRSLWRKHALPSWKLICFRCKPRYYGHSPAFRTTRWPATWKTSWNGLDRLIVTPASCGSSASTSSSTLRST